MRERIRDEIMDRKREAKPDVKRELKSLRSNLDKVLFSFAELMKPQVQDDLKAAGIDRNGLRKSWDEITTTSLGMRKLKASEQVADEMSERIAADMVVAKDLVSVTYTRKIVFPMGSGFSKLDNLDKSFIGSNDYMGIAYFWSSAYKHGLRAASAVKRRQVHDALLSARLDLDGESPEHEEIIRKLGAY